MGRCPLEAVNQFFLLNQFQEHASRFAHQLDDAMGHNTLQSASEEDRLVTFQTLRDMIGSTWRRYKVWDAINPEELVVGGNFDGTPLWKRTEDEYVEIDKRLCGQCDIATFARRFLFQANLPLFPAALQVWDNLLGRQKHDHLNGNGQLFDVATQPESSFYDALEAEYHAALLHYDEIVGASDNT